MIFTHKQCNTFKAPKPNGIPTSTLYSIGVLVNKESLSHISMYFLCLYYASCWKQLSGPWSPRAVSSHLILLAEGFLLISFFPSLSQGSTSTSVSSALVTCILNSASPSWKLLIHSKSLAKYCVMQLRPVNIMLHSEHTHLHTQVWVGSLNWLVFCIWHFVCKLVCSSPKINPDIVSSGEVTCPQDDRHVEKNTE